MDTTTASSADLDPFAEGFFVGLLVGEGHFGGDGRQAQITLRMHTRHEQLFHWLVAQFPGSRLYGPYNHGGRSYYQWMARGRYLSEVVVPIIAARLGFMDDHVAARFREMCQRYGIPLHESPQESTANAGRGAR